MSNPIFGSSQQSQSQSGKQGIGQLLDFIKTHDTETAYDEAQKLIKERGISDDELKGIVGQAQEIISMFGIK